MGKKIRLEFSRRGEPRQKTPGRYAGYVPKRRSRSRSKRRHRSSSSDRSYSRRKLDIITILSVKETEKVEADLTEEDQRANRDAGTEADLTAEKTVEGEDDPKLSKININIQIKPTSGPNIKPNLKFVIFPSHLVIEI